jgi:hypothetical protein
MKNRTSSLRSVGSPAPVTRLGVVAAWSDDDGLLVEYDGSSGPVAALNTVPLTADAIDALVAERAQVVLTFDSASGRPIVLGVVQPAPAPRAEPVHAVVDGEPVVIEGKERIELRCGAASLVLTKAGKVLIQGTYVSSSSSGALRLRGASVEVN